MKPQAAGALVACLMLSDARGVQVPAPLPGCLAARPVELLVRIGDDAAPRRALLSGGIAPALQLREAESGDILWTAGATLPASQIFEPMRAAFAGSLAVIDLDGDGLHDRLYAGDLAGRLWRFDMHHGQAAHTWLTGGVFADFSGEGRAFVAPPDVSLSAGAGAQPWLHIALGTASLGNAPASNRFYVLRDFAAFDTWTAAQYAAWTPLRERALLPLRGPGESRDIDTPADERSVAGYFTDIGSAQMLLPSLTISGRAVLALSDASITAGCQIAVRILTVDLQQGTLQRGRLLDRQGDVQSSPVLPSTSRLQLAPRDEAGQRWSCQLEQLTVEGCEVDTRPRLRWWRRTDAD